MLEQDKKFDLLISHAEAGICTGNFDRAKCIYEAIMSKFPEQISGEILCNLAFVCETIQEKHDYYKLAVEKYQDDYACNMLGVFKHRYGIGDTPARVYFENSHCGEGLFNLAVLSDSMSQKMQYLQQAWSEYAHIPSLKKLKELNPEGDYGDVKDEPDKKPEVSLKEHDKLIVDAVLEFDDYDFFVGFSESPTGKVEALSIHLNRKLGKPVILCTPYIKNPDKLVIISYGEPERIEKLLADSPYIKSQKRVSGMIVSAINRKDYSDFKEALKKCRIASLK